MKTAPMSTENQNTFFFRAIRMALKPMVRLAISRGISVNDFLLGLKSLYVEEAEQFTLEGRKQSASRISVLTGLDRKEVAKIRKLNEDVDEVFNINNKKTNRAIRAINEWKTNALYQKNGHPIPLALDDSKKGFFTLVQNACGDISPSAILDELKQASLIEIINNKQVKLIKSSYIPNENEDEMLALMGQASYDLLSTSIHNIQNDPKDSRLQLSVAYDDVSEEVANKFRVLIKRDSRELLEKLNRWFIEEIELHGEVEAEDTRRLGLGIYYFEDSPQDDESK